MTQPKAGAQLRLRQPNPTYKALARYVQEASLKEQAIVGARALTGVLGRRVSKIFAIGMNKAGTTSLHQLFVDFGYHSYHGVRWRSGANKLLLNGFQCFSDGPPDDFKALDREFPDSLFILNVRDFESWALSRLMHIARDKLKRPGEVFPVDWDVTETSINLWLNQRDRHHAEVLRYFAKRPDDLLVVNFIRDPDAAAKVARFLGKPTPEGKPWSNSAKGRGSEPSHKAMLDAVLARRGVSAADAQRDLLVVRAPANADLPPDTSALPARIPPRPADVALEPS